MLRGSEFVANVNLSSKGVSVARAGETCERVAVSSLAWLEEQGLISRAKPARREVKAQEGFDGVIAKPTPFLVGERESAPNRPAKE